MTRYFSLFLSCCILVIFSCSDGDVIEFELDFEDEFSACEDNDLVLFKTKESPSESVSVLFASLTLDDIFEDVPTFIQDTLTPSATFLYRTYNTSELPSDLFCTTIPPANLNIDIDEDSSCNTQIIRLLVEDDNDGIDAEFESENGINPLGDDDGDNVLNYLDDAINDASIGDTNGAIEDGFDTDGDGLPNFIDEDDDGDNVPTSSENPDPDGDGDPSDAQNTDAELTNPDSIPDYLDTDDDGDGVLTRDEESVLKDEAPINDVTNGETADYLNENVSESIQADAYREHNINKTYTIRLIVNDINISFLLQETFDFGTLDLTNIEATDFNLDNNRKVTPAFP